MGVLRLSDQPMGLSNAAPVIESPLLRSDDALSPIILAIFTRYVPFIKKCAWCRGAGCDPGEYRSWSAHEELCSCCYGNGCHAFKSSTHCSLENIQTRLLKKRQQLDAQLTVVSAACNEAFIKADEEKKIRVMQILRSVKFKTLSDKNTAVSREELSLNSSFIRTSDLLRLTGLPTTKKKRAYLNLSQQQGDLLKGMMDVADNLSRIERARNRLAHKPLMQENKRAKLA